MLLSVVANHIARNARAAHQLADHNLCKEIVHFPNSSKNIFRYICMYIFIPSYHTLTICLLCHQYTLIHVRKLRHHKDTRVFKLFVSATWICPHILYISMITRFHFWIICTLYVHCNERASLACRLNKVWKGR